MVRAEDVVIIASRMEDDWTALPLSAGFLPFLDVVVNRIATGGGWLVPATAGATPDLPAGAEVVGASTPLEPGVYFLRGGAGDTVGALEVNHDRRESRLDPADRSAVRAAASAYNTAASKPSGQSAHFGARRRRRPRPATRGSMYSAVSGVCHRMMSLTSMVF